MKTKFSTIAVLIACHNRKQKTISCLEHLYNQTGINKNFSLEVFLVDDASTDGTAEAIESKFPQINLIKGDGNLFWSKAMHLAWKTASRKQDYDFYLWLNDDVLIFHDAVSVILENHFTSINEVIICGATKSQTTDKYTYGGQTIKGRNIIPNGSLQSCTIMNGNFVLVSHKIFKHIGMIDSIFPHSIGDHDYGLRAIKYGFTIFIAPVYIGYCESHERLPKWCLKDVPLLERIRSLYSPLGNCHPYYFFVFEKRHFGLLIAIKHFFSIHLRVLLPFLWSQKIS